jgi:hypothetical protein
LCFMIRSKPQMEPLTHEPSSDHEEWNESYYFIFYDKENEIGGMSRVGFKPNKKEGMTFFFLFLPDGSVGAYHANDEASHYPEKLRVENLEHTCHSQAHWHYTFEGPMLLFDNPEDFLQVKENPEVISDLLGAKIDLEYAPLSETYEYSEHMTPESLEIGKKSGDMHWEQIGRVTGTARVGDKEYHVDSCIGQRDHTHGIRDWTGVGNWFYFVVWFDEKLAINPAAILLEDGRSSTGGFLYRDGENIPLKEIHVIEHSYREGAVFPLSTELRIIDAIGDEHTLKAKPGRIVPVPFRNDDGTVSILIQSFGEFELDGRSGGYGSYEVLRKGQREE